MTTRRFEPTVRYIVRENLWLALGITVAMLLLLYVAKVERDPAILAAFSLGPAAAAFVFYVGRELARGLCTVEIREREIWVQTWRDERTMRWDDVAGCEMWFKKGEQWWTFTSERDGRSFSFHLEGHSLPATAEVQAAIAERMRTLPGAETPSTSISALV